MKFTAASTAAISGDITISGTVKDVFGNDLSTALVAGSFGIANLGGNLTGAAVADPAADKFAYDATTKVYTIKATARDSAGTQAVSVVIDGANKASLTLAAFPAATTSAFFAITVSDLAVAVASLTAQVASLTADYNALATRWNKKVDSKRRVFNKVALK
jgi:hypothetical protein